jgi:hypothetical protein
MLISPPQRDEIPTYDIRECRKTLPAKGACTGHHDPELETVH